MKDNKDDNIYNKVREIEFRGKDIKTKEWYYGSLVSKYDVDAGLYCQYHILEKFEYSRSCDLDSDLVNVDFYEVDENTLGQFTGLCDKNGVKIYEGDILCMTFSNEWTNNEERKIYYSVKFTDGMFATFYKDYENGQWEDIEDNRLDKALIEVDKLEVVGNIYDNPDLLGGGDEECDN